MSLRQDLGEARRLSAESSDQDQGMRIVSFLLVGMICYGGLGWVVDHFAGTQFGVPVGLLFGTAVSLWVIIKRYGRAA